MQDTEATPLTQDIPSTNAFVILVRFWPLIIALIMAAGILGESRYRLSDLESKFIQLEKRSDDRFSAITEEMKEDRKELKKLNRELRVGLGKVQLSMARICVKLNVECD